MWGRHVQTLERYHVELPGAGLDRPGSVIRYGHWGQPVLAFASEKGRAWDFENNGMVGAVADLLEAGRIRLYCVDSFDHLSWSDDRRTIEERAQRHQVFRSWITDTVMPWIGDDSPTHPQAIAVGCSLGAYHALHLSLTRSDLFPVALCMSGNYDTATFNAWGASGEAAYRANPAHFVPGLGGDRLDRLQQRVHVVLTVGQGAWEVHPTSALPSTLQMSAMLTDKGISHDLDVWGPDASHDWPSWRQQLARHLPRFC